MSMQSLKIPVSAGHKNIKLKERLKPKENPDPDPDGVMTILKLYQLSLQLKVSSLNTLNIRT
jgi:hypothetical protein